jgi:nucleoside 2-deoxyribosyltransferase
LRILSDELPRLIASVRAPESPLESADELLVHLANRARRYGDDVHVKGTDWARYRLADEAALNGVVLLLRELGMLKLESSNPTGHHTSLTVPGWKRAAELRHVSGDGRLAFVAMSFDATLFSVYTEAIQPAIEVDCGYTAVRVDRQQYNDKIDDRIIAELRRARFVVADVTMQKAGVYFEAGFAFGLGRPVIYSCRKDDMNNTHFDTRQYNHIVWETHAELRERLATRIAATIGTREQV